MKSAVFHIFGKISQTLQILSNLVLKSQPVHIKLIFEKTNLNAACNTGMEPHI